MTTAQKVDACVSTGQKHRYVWMVASLGEGYNGPPQSLIKYDCETDSMDEWHQGERYFTDEPTFVAWEGSGVHNASIFCFVDGFECGVSFSLWRACVRLPACHAPCMLPRLLDC